MTEVNLFEQATRNKFRYVTTKGSVTTEDLWDLALNELDNVAKLLNKQIKEATEESYIQTKSSANTVLQQKFDIVIRIINVKLQEQKERELAKEKKARKQQLLELIEQKENEKLSSLSIDELRKQLEEL